MGLNETPLDQISLLGKNVYVHGILCIYHDAMDELKIALRRYGAVLQDNITDETDIIVCGVYCYRNWDDSITGLPEGVEDKLLSEILFYEILSNLGETGTRRRKISDAEMHASYSLRCYYERKEIALRDNFYAFPSFEMKNVFLHGKFHRHRKTFDQILTKYGGVLEDEFTDNTDIVVCGWNFSLEFLDRMEELRKSRRLIIMDEDNFFKQLEKIKQLEKFEDYGTSYPETENTNRWKLYLNEMQYAQKLVSKGKLEQAIELYEKIQKMKVGRDDALWSIVSIHRKNKDYVKELRILDRLAVSREFRPEPDSDGVDQYLGYIEERRERVRKIIKNQKAKKKLATLGKNFKSK